MTWWSTSILGVHLDAIDFEYLYNAIDYEYLLMKTFSPNPN
jgi:hypothetical protein